MKIFERGELKLLWPFYLDHLFSPMLYFFPAFYILFLKDFNFSYFQISILISAIPFFSFISEIPTGAIADIYGRKISVLASAFLGMISMFSIYFTKSYLALFLSFALFGISLSLSSGAKEAWVVDLIKDKKLSKRYFTKSSSLDSMGLLLSGIIGSLVVAKHGLNVIWIFAGFSFLISLIFLPLAKENFKKRKFSINDSYRKVKNQSIKAISFSYNNHVIFWFLAASVILILAGSLSGLFTWTIFLNENGFPDYAFGYLWSAMSAIGIVAPFATQYFVKSGSERKFILTLISLELIIILLVFFSSSLSTAITILMLMVLVNYTQRPVERMFFHKFIPSKMRATIGSVEGMLLSLFLFIGVPLSGLIIDKIGAKYTLMLEVFLLIPAIIIFYNIKEPKAV